ncbi:MAG: hypothetical protein H6621_12265 [Halobacteriovoraceae bacterium]|nr:hypothetical protein [Halobacteriovoraceae bacterium]MCB9095834.1 hypothetical protein [Halobacteriovoraceae bacterium]
MIKHTLWDNINKLQWATNLRDNEFAEVCELKKESFIKCKENLDDLPLDVVINISEKFNVTIESLCFKNVDSTVAADYYLGKCELLPQKYSWAKHSRHRTIINLLDYIEKSIGWHNKIMLLRYFQIHEGYFSDPDGKINLYFIHDLCKYFDKKEFPKSFFFGMGANSFQSNAENDLGKTLASFRTPQEVYMAVAEEFSKRFDENYTYEIENIHGNEIYFREHLKKEVNEELQNFQGKGTTSVAYTKAGVLSTFPCYIGAEPANVHITHCEHSGDKMTRYRIEVPEYEKCLN